MIDPSAAFQVSAQLDERANGSEPLLGGQLREKAVWVDEAVCIGCRYCAHVATNTFVIEPTMGRSRAIRQHGDSTERIKAAIATCPENCIKWVQFEQLDELRAQLEALELLPLGFQRTSRKRRNHGS